MVAVPDLRCVASRRRRYPANRYPRTGNPRRADPRGAEPARTAGGVGIEVSNVFAKLDVSSRTQVVALGRNLGIRSQ